MVLLRSINYLSNVIILLCNSYYVIILIIQFDKYKVGRVFPMVISSELNMAPCVYRDRCHREDSPHFSFQKGRIYSVFLSFYNIMKNEKIESDNGSYRFIRFPTELIRSDLLGCYYHAVNETYHVTTMSHINDS